MNLEDFQLIHEMKIDHWNILRDYIKINDQQGAQLNNPDRKIEIIFGENNTFHQLGNAYLQYDITVRKGTISVNPLNHLDPDFENGDVIRSVEKTLANTFKHATFSNTRGSKTESKNFVGLISTFIRVLTSKNGVLISYFNKIAECERGKRNSSFKKT